MPTLNMKTIIDCLIALSVFLVMAFFSVSFLDLLPEAFEDCKSNLSLSGSNAVINSHMVFHFYNGKGSAEIRGFYTTGENKNQVLSRDIFFDYIKQKNKYVLTNSGIESRDNDQNIRNDIDKIMPAFFLKPDAMLILNRTKSGNGEKIFSWSGLPVLYCLR
ncbi:hypothetical protein MUA02_07275 [Enterobacteriaceae bacterium H20N1]|uniref:Uncharacterized protein n=1 Tax=Dryocola boscaweniae TaxID=2925397 RepID=A0A9X2W605_9ENTR|nr:hypothetical protein [Dryocola boscaweniae]MCT4701678.1 hypothetical protein [Dryocola boscaweniae]MCT4718847.1 hypothetical protein [Dryocola boscaweniae]